jgi:uncharacterized protein YutE (UPF0331/DUF86 family)
MNSDVSDIINRKLRELEDNVLALKQISLYVNEDNLREDTIRYWGIERGIQICIQCILDIGNILISHAGQHKPSTYRETMLSLAQINVVSKEFASKLALMAGFRTVLVHDYTKIDEKIILNVLKSGLDDFIEFMECTNLWLKDNFN